MKKQFVSILVAVVVLIGVLPVMTSQASASGTYQLSKAVEYALAHAKDPGSDDPDGCAKFVSACLAAGGITVPNEYMYNSSDRVDPEYSGTIGVYSNPHTCARAMLKWLMEEGYYTVKRPSNGADIEWCEINVGDIVFMTSGTIYGHVVIVTGRDPETGESLYSAHSNSRLDYPLGNRANYVVQLSKYSNSTDVPTSPDSTISIVPTTAPQKNHVLGTPFYFRGSITSNYPIVSATVKIVTADWTKTIQEKTVWPNKTNVDILADGLDALKFGELPEGDYVLHLMARNSASEELATWTSAFSVRDGKSKLEIHPMQYPQGEVTFGQAFDLKGTITSNYPITSATIKIVSADWTRTIQEKTVWPNKTEVDFQTDGLSCLKFEDLPAGNYTLCLEVKDSFSEEIKSWVSPFVVVEKLPDGLHKDADGVMRYYRNGAVDKNYTNFVSHTDGKQYYIKNGVQVSTTGIISHTNGRQYYVKKGVRQYTTGLVKHTNGKWYHVVNGVRQYTNGLVKHTNGKLHYVENGVLTKITNFIKHTDGKQYYVQKGIVEKFTGLVTHTNGKQYYVKDGVRQNTTEIVTHTNGKQYYVENGVRQHTTGIVKHTNGKQYYVKDGVRQSTTGLVKHTNGKYYYVQKGVRQTTTGLVMHTNGKLHYVKSGVLDKTFNGKWKHTDGKTYTVVKGVVQK